MSSTWCDTCIKKIPTGNLSRGLCSKLEQEAFNKTLKAWKSLAGTDVQKVSLTDIYAHIEVSLDMSLCADITQSNLSK